MVSNLANWRVFIVTLSNDAKKWLRSLTSSSISTWQQLSTSFLRQFQVTKQFAVPLTHLGNVEQQEGESLKSYLNQFVTELSSVRWALDARVLAHLTNKVLLETLFQDELQQNECKNVSEFYIKVIKYLKLENSKKALCKAKEPSTSKKTSQENKIEDKKKGKKRKTGEKTIQKP